jgi:putative MFS transporter
LLEPHYGWRILWFAGLPTGLLLLVLNRWIPESPRFLLEHGRVEEAEKLMRRYGVVLTRNEPSMASPAAAPTTPPGQGSRLAALFRMPYLTQTLAIGMYGFAWGLVNWGFLTFTPTILRDRGLDAATASGLLFWSALTAVPGTIIVAYLYGLWSSKKSMILFCGLTTAALVAFAIVDPGSGGRTSLWLMPLMVTLLVGTGGIISMLSPYAAEVYPTHLRGTGSGFAAGSSKVGGILAPPLAAAILGATPGFYLLGFAVAAPVAIAGVVLALVGLETRDRGLEDLAATAAKAPVTMPPIEDMG